MKPVIDWETKQPIEFPCEFCTGNSVVRHIKEDRFLTSEEFCELVETCSATVDWEKVYSHET